MRFSPKLRAVAVAAVLVVITTAAGCADGGSKAAAKFTSDEARHFAIERMQNFLGSAERVGILYTTLDEALPNVVYQHTNGRQARASDLAVVGTIVSVDKGRGFTVGGDDASSGTPSDFDTKGARWWSLHMTVNVEKVIGSSDAPKQVRVALSSPPPEDFPKMAEGLRSLGKVVMLLRAGSPLVDYDPSLYVVAEDGALWATVADDGSLTLPFVSEVRNQRMLRATPRLSDLERQGAAPRVVPTTGVENQERRVDGQTP
jgi:hypothetical protein